MFVLSNSIIIPIFILVTFMFLATPIDAYANNSSYHIEDKNLKPVAMNIAQAIREMEQNKFAECGFVGKKITETSNKNLYFVTTSNACNWGANFGPIWVVESNTVLIRDTSYVLDISNESYYPDFKIRGGSAGHASINLWRYIEDRYQIIERLYFTADCNSKNKFHPENPFKCEYV